LTSAKRPENEEWERVGVTYTIWDSKWILLIISIIVIILDRFRGERLEETIHVIALIIVAQALLSLFLTKVRPCVICPCGMRVFLSNRKCPNCERIIPYSFYKE